MSIIFYFLSYILGQEGLLFTPVSITTLIGRNRIRIVDVADALGLSTATISKVIHGKTEKISDKTVIRVQQDRERSGYILNSAGLLLARNNSDLLYR